MVNDRVFFKKIKILESSMKLTAQSTTQDHNE